MTNKTHIKKSLQEHTRKDCITNKEIEKEVEYTLAQAYYNGNLIIRAIKANGVPTIDELIHFIETHL